MEKGLILTVLGMSWVFIFLFFIVVFTHLSSRIILKFFPEKTDQNKITGSVDNDNENIAIAIALAHHHKKGSL